MYVMVVILVFTTRQFVNHYRIEYYAMVCYHPVWKIDLWMANHTETDVQGEN